MLYGIKIRSKYGPDSSGSFQFIAISLTGSFPLTCGIVLLFEFIEKYQLVKKVHMKNLDQKAAVLDIWLRLDLKVYGKMKKETKQDNQMKKKKKLK